MSIGFDLAERQEYLKFAKAATTGLVINPSDKIRAKLFCEKLLTIHLFWAEGLNCPQDDELKAEITRVNLELQNLYNQLS